MDTSTAASDHAAAAEAVAERYGRDSDFLIPMLQDLQAQFGHLPREAVNRLSGILNVPLSRFYSVATFYTSFSLAPRGKHLITLCMGTVCYLKGAGEIAKTIQSQLNIEAGETTEDGLFTFQPVNCLGACALAPVMVIDEEYFGKVKPDEVADVLAKYAAEEDSSGRGD